METVNNLKWMVEADQSWIKVNPITGEGKARISVTANNSDVRSEELSVILMYVYLIS